MALLIPVRPGALVYSDVRMENTYILLFSRLQWEIRKRRRLAGRGRHRAKTSRLFAGSTRAAEWPKSCSGCGSATTRPPLPITPGLTQFSYTSLLKTSRHSPPPGKPMR